MTGTILNVAGILLGGFFGFARSAAHSATVEFNLRLVLAAFTVFYGLRLTWLSLNGSLAQILKQCLILIVSLILGKLIGKVLHLQSVSNRLGRRAHEQIKATAIAGRRSPNRAFKICAILFCAS